MTTILFQDRMYYATGRWAVPRPGDVFIAEPRITTDSGIQPLIADENVSWNQKQEILLPCEDATLPDAVEQAQPKLARIRGIIQTYNLGTISCQRAISEIELTVGA